MLAILFAATEPVTIEQLRQIFPDLAIVGFEERVGRVVEEFNAVQDALEIRKVAGGLRLTTRP